MGINLLDEQYSIFEQKILAKGIKIDEIKNKLKAQRIETPSWGYNDSGTRFKVFHQPGAARNIYERLQDAAQVNKFTGICPSVAIHIPWDKVKDFKKLKQYAKSLRLKIGAINPNLFQDDDYKLGSICNPNSTVRRKAVNHILECIEIAKEVDSTILSLWFADGTNYPGQDSIRTRKKLMEDCLKEVYSLLPDNMRMLIEYKFFEPAFFHTDISDWGISYVLTKKLGEKAQVLVDIGHHPQGTNIAQIVAFLLDERKLGGFHFNDRKYADDDLTLGSINPYKLFLIYNEIVDAQKDINLKEDVELIAFMIDQSHNVKPKIEAMIQSVVNAQTAYAKTLLVEREKLVKAQNEGNIIEAEQILINTFQTDVKPLLEKLRLEMGLDPNPIEAYKESKYYNKIREERG